MRTALVWTRARGKPRTRGMDRVEEDMRKRGVQLMDAEEGSVWRRTIRTLTSSGLKPVVEEEEEGELLVSWSETPFDLAFLQVEVKLHCKRLSLTLMYIQVDR